MEEGGVWMMQYGQANTSIQNKFTLKVGDLVRISHLRRNFQREYDERYTDELFKVKSRSKRAGLNVYTLNDLQDEQVEGTFYDKELQQVKADLDDVFKIETVIHSRKKRGSEKEYLIKWRGYPKKFNSWVKASDMQQV